MGVIYKLSPRLDAAWLPLPLFGFYFFNAQVVVTERTFWSPEPPKYEIESPSQALSINDNYSGIRVHLKIDIRV